MRHCDGEQAGGVRYAFQSGSDVPENRGEGPHAAVRGRLDTCLIVFKCTDSLMGIKRELNHNSK